MVMNTKQAVVVNPILTNHAKKYVNPAFVLGNIFPEVPVTSRHGEVINFGKQDFRVYNTRRAPGSKTKRIQVGYAGEPIALYQDSLEALTPFELQDEAGNISVDLQAAAVNTVLNSLMLGTEVGRAKLATDATQYGADNKLALSGSSQWSDPTADVRGMANAAKEQVRRKTGHKANQMTISPGIEIALGNNNQVRDQFKFTSGESVTVEMLARFFQVDRVNVVEAVSLPEGAPVTADFTDAWGNFAHFCYVPTSTAGIHQPSFGYTYRLNGYPMVEQAYESRNEKSFVHPVTLQERGYLTSPEAGFLYSNVIDLS